MPLGRMCLLSEKRDLVSGKIVRALWNEKKWQSGAFKVDDTVV